MIEVPLLRTTHPRFETSRNKLWTFYTLTSCFSKETSQNICCEMKFLFSAILPAARGESSERKERTEQHFVGLPGRFLQNSLYPLRQKCWETWETFIFTTAFPNLITSAIRLHWHENELAEGSAGAVTSTVCLGQPKNRKKKKRFWDLA